MQFKSPAMLGATAAAAALLLCAVLAISYSSTSYTALESVQPAQMTAKEAKAEMLASAAQKRLAQKDARIYQSLAAVAKKKVVEGAHDEEAFMKARKTQVELDERLEQLTQRFEAQREALEYMAPRTRARDVDTMRLQSFVQQLQTSLPMLSKDVDAVKKAVAKTEEEAKPAKREMRISDEILKKTSNAYMLFQQRSQTSREKAELSRQKVQELNQGAMYAQQTASKLRSQAQQQQDKRAAELLLQEAETEESKAQMLAKEADESLQSAQLFDAEAAEADSYTAMFGADAGAAKNRLAAAGKKLEMLKTQYFQGKRLEAQAEQREQYLATQLQAAEQQLGVSFTDAKEDQTALKTGEKAIERTVSELKKDRAHAEANTITAEKDVEAMEGQKRAWAADAQQALSVEQQINDHMGAARDFKEAAQAADQEEQADADSAPQQQ